MLIYFLSANLVNTNLRISMDSKMIKTFRITMERKMVMKKTNKRVKMIFLIKSKEMDKI